MSDFNLLLIEGLFYQRGADLYIEQDSGVHRSVTEALLPLVGQRVQFAMHHLPPNGLQAGEPGAGSCRFPQGVGCPVQHDKRPDHLLSFHLDGVLRNTPTWGVEKFDGKVVSIPFVGMVGHFGRVAAATILDVEAMRDSLLKTATSMGSSGLNAKDIETLLDRLRKGVGH